MTVKATDGRGARGYGAPVPPPPYPGSDSAASVRKALLVLEEVAASQPVTVAVLARTLDLPKTTVQRSLVTLGEAGWLVQSEIDRSWSVSAKLASLARRSISEYSLRQAAAEPMRTVRDLTGESVVLMEREGDDVVIIDSIASGHIVQAIAPVGARFPLDMSAGGMAIVAANGGNGPALEAIRERGWAEQHEAFDATVASVAAAILSPRDERAVAALVVFGPASRFTAAKVRRAAPVVVQAASDVTRMLAR
jgi:IclR family transcriptional regulator, acetate operon repressor